MIVADSLASVADAAFAHAGGPINTPTAWLGALAYALQIYFDFSGYSDMAVGLGLMFGFRLPENFARPYSAYSITDFWRRWHMSLSRWFRDYVYIPLGGNRGGAPKTHRNLMIIFVLCGFWHGADWTFLVWGLYHGALLVAERLLGWDRPPGAAWALVLRRGATLLLVVVGWVFFRAESMTEAWGMLRAMFTWQPGELDEFVAFAANHQRMVVFALALTVVALPASPALGPLIQAERGPVAVRLARAAVTWAAAPTRRRWSPPALSALSCTTSSDEDTDDRCTGRTGAMRSRGPRRVGATSDDDARGGAVLLRARAGLRRGRPGGGDREPQAAGVPGVVARLGGPAGCGGVGVGSPATAAARRPRQRRPVGTPVPGGALIRHGGRPGLSAGDRGA
nr:hypothetical protein GCM10020093_090920 [Planobispora longispora]